MEKLNLSRSDEFIRLTNPVADNDNGIIQSFDMVIHKDYVESIRLFLQESFNLKDVYFTKIEPTNRKFNELKLTKHAL